MSMTDDSNGDETGSKALEGLIAHIAQTSARAAHNIGVEFDLDDPRVARWLILATLEGMFLRSAQSSIADLMALAEKASEGECRSSSRKSSKAETKIPLVTWDDLIASAKTTARSDLRPKRAKG
jgi:hypothetical protein